MRCAHKYLLCDMRILTYRRPPNQGTLWTNMLRRDSSQFVMASVLITACWEWHYYLKRLFESNFDYLVGPNGALSFHCCTILWIALFTSRVGTWQGHCSLFAHHSMQGSSVTIISTTNDIDQTASPSDASLEHAHSKSSHLFYLHLSLPSIWLNYQSQMS